MIELKSIDKIYGKEGVNGFYALKDINLSIKKNEMVVIKGISGSGKSTLLSIIASFLKPTSGHICVNGELTAKLPDEHISSFRLNNIGFVYQSFNLMEQFTVYENLIAPLIPLDIDSEKIDQKINKALKEAKIYHKKDQIVSNLSGGEKQRCAIARAIVNDADIILCDEPTANLDYDNSLNFIDILKSMKQSGKTIIIATHDPIFDTLGFIDRIINISGGKIE